MFEEKFLEYLKYCFLYSVVPQKEKVFKKIEEFLPFITINNLGDDLFEFCFGEDDVVTIDFVWDSKRDDGQFKLINMKLI